MDSDRCAVANHVYMIVLQEAHLSTPDPGTYTTALHARLIFACLLPCVCACACMCVLAVYNKAQAQRISNREFKLWTFLQGTESRVATFLAEM